MTDEYYPVSARDYLARAAHHLAADDPATLFYAAFELRCGVEARLQEYLEPHDHIAARKKSEWRAANLGKTADRAFKTGTRVARVQFLDPQTQEPNETYFYTPVTPELRRLVDKLGDYLHASRRHRAASDPWWAKLRTNLEAAYDLLEDATFGTLLGPPLINRKTGELRLPLEIPPGTPEPAPFVVGAKALIQVR